MFTRKNNPLVLVSLLIVIFAFVLIGFIDEAQKNNVLQSVVDFGSTLNEKTYSDEKQNNKHSNDKFNQLAKVSNTLKNWPPEVGAKFIDQDYFDVNGNKFNLHVLRGKPTLLMMTAASSPGSLAWAGAHEFGAYKGHPAQNNLSAISEYYNYYTGGFELYSGEIQQMMTKPLF